MTEPTAQDWLNETMEKMAEVRTQNDLVDFIQWIILSSTKKDENGWTDAQKLEHIYEAIDDMDYAFDNYTDATTVSSQAHWLMKMHDAATALETWHPDYDSDLGIIKREDD